MFSLLILVPSKAIFAGNSASVHTNAFVLIQPLDEPSTGWEMSFLGVELVADIGKCCVFAYEARFSSDAQLIA